MMPDPGTQLAHISVVASDLDETLDRLFTNATEMRAILERISAQSKKADTDD